MKKHWLYNILDFFYTLFFHRRIIRLMEEELAKPFESRVQKMIVEQGKVDITIESPTVRIWCGMFSQLLNSYPGADNYLNFTFEDDKSQMWELMLQRITGKRPMDFMHEQREEIARLKQQITKLQESHV